MIYVYLEGRFGNLLYCIATAATLAQRYDEPYCAVVNKNYYCTPPDDCLLPEYIAPLKNTIFRNIPFADEVPLTCPWHDCNSQIPEIIKGQDMCLYSFEVTDYSPELAASLFAPSEQIISQLQELYPTLNHEYTCSVAVRRGDFLTLPMHSPAEDYAFYRKCMKRLEKKWHTKDIHYFITSDDIEWCKQHFVGKQFTFVEDTYLNQLYIAALCRCNILSNSTFAQWGGVINVHKDKVVYYPDPIGGIGVRNRTFYHLNAPIGWIPIKHYSSEYKRGVRLWLKEGIKKRIITLYCKLCGKSQSK